jgi:hypothetical protein
MTSYKQLFQTHSKFINHIPFIKLGEVDNLDELVAEANQLYKNYTPTALLSKHPTDATYTGVDVLGIYDYSGQNISQFGDSYLLLKQPTDIAFAGIYDYHGQNISQLGDLYSEQNHNTVAAGLNYQMGELTQQTELGKQLPKISAVINDLLDHPGRVRLSKLQSRKFGGWHSHGYNKLLEITLHIPLVSNTLVQAQSGYCPILGGDSYRYLVPDTYHTTHFKPGEIWLLNGMFSHRVTNESDHDRIHVWSQSMFLDHQKNIVNTKLLDMLTHAVLQYQGPYIEK